MPCRSHVLPGWRAVHGSGRRASRGPQSYSEGPGAEELLQLQDQLLNLCLNHGTLPQTSFVVGLVWVYVALVPAPVQLRCATYSSPSSPSPCCRDTCSLGTSSFQSLSPQREKCLSWRLQMSYEICVDKEAASFGKADRLQKCYLCFVLTPG